ncbi:MAG: FAD:protein FMN transferase [Candidatus Gracilibacteria bacterium]|jgi:thiamine biosynthesis lipoprotein
MQPLIFEQTSMDTRVTITLYSNDAGENKSVGGGNGGKTEKSVEKAFMVFKDLEKQFSLFKADSEICLVNGKAGEVTSVSPLFLDVLDYALGFAEKSEGAFNPLVGAFTPGFQRNYESFPEIKTSEDLAAFEQIVVNKEKSTVLLPKNAALDLNSVIKGLAIDLAMDCFEEPAVMIEAGGDIRVKGTPPNKKNWDVGIRDPKNPTKLITVLHIIDAAICTSGNYFRKEKLADEGKLHLVNAAAHLASQAAPQANRANSNPANSPNQENELSSVTVVAPTAKMADVLSTAIFFMPVESAILFIEKFEGCSCLLIDNKNELYMSPKMRAYFQP